MSQAPALPLAPFETQQQWSPGADLRADGDGARETASQLQHHLSRLEGWVYGAYPMQNISDAKAGVG